MTNEQYTESLTLKEMKVSIGENDFGFVYPQGDVPMLDKVESLLKKAGGKPKECEINDYSIVSKGKAKPEFIITFNNDSNTIIVVECKKTIKHHETEEKNKPSAYAVDGVLYYAKFLKEDYNVVALAVSGTQKDKIKVSSFYWQKGQDTYTELRKARDIILEPQHYIDIINGKKLQKSYSLEDIRSTAIEMHEYLREIKMNERHKPIFIAGILIALEDKDFLDMYDSLPSYEKVLRNIESSIESVLEDSDIKSNRIKYIQQAFKTLFENSKFKEIPLGHKKSITWYIEQLELKIKPMMDHADSTVDALGVFYHEFIKYSGGDGKGLGIVLTPQHLTEFMCDVAGVSKNSRVIDICCGSASFLVTAMSKMFKDANPEEVESIKKQQLYGVEFDEELYSLAIANMIIRKDGKSNVYYGDCFNKDIVKEIKNKNINIGLINPPYSQKDNVELEFLEHLLDVLVVGGTAVCVVPMSCAIGTKFKDVRERLFKKHTLDAVFSMPSDIFYPTGTDTCVMVWKAHTSHTVEKETFFGYYTDDGFVKKKKLGRVDYHNTWESIRTEWLKLYNNKDIKAGISTRKAVKHSEEWCAEAYMETDYNVLDKEAFIDTIHSYSAYNFTRKFITNCEKLSVIDKENELDIKKWKYFTISEYFMFSRGNRLVKTDRDFGDIPFITAGKENYGFKQCIDSNTLEQKIYSNAITIDMFNNCFFHYNNFSCDDNILVLEPLEDFKSKITKYVMVFITTIIAQDSYRCAYGRQYRQKNLVSHKIKLPVDKNGEPDWQFMEDYIKSLPYSFNL